jgi:hypothetical protein
VIVEAHAPIADAQTKLRRGNPAQSLNITRACGGEAVNRSGDAKRHGAVELGQIGFGLSGNRDA